MTVFCVWKLAPLSFLGSFRDTLSVAWGLLEVFPSVTDPS